MASNEAGLVDQITKAVAKRYPDAWQFKVVGSPYQMSGVPDLLFCIHGLMIGAEVKHQKPGESEEHARSRASALQRVQIMRINRSGGMAGVVLSVEETFDLIERGLQNRFGFDRPQTTQEES